MIEEVVDGVGFRIHADGSARSFAWSERPAPHETEAYDWIHLNIGSAPARRWLTERSGLDPIVIDALLEEETRPRCAPIAGGLLVILRGVNEHPDADPEDLVSLRMWVAEDLVVTTRRRPSMAIRDLRREAEAGTAPPSAGDMLVEIADRLVERMSSALASLDERMDTVEETLVESPLQQLRIDLTTIRREAITMRRHLAPQRDALLRILGERVPWLSEMQRLRLHEVTDATIRHVEDLEAARDRTAVTQEELSARLSEQINQRMYALSIVAVVFLPLSFVTGLLGINVGGIPGASSPVAFATVCGGLAAVGIGQLLLLRRIGWL